MTPRLYVPGEPAIGAATPLDRGQAHYLRHVLRLGHGAPVSIFNGARGEFAGVLEPIGKLDAAVRVVSPTRPPDPARDPDLWLLAAPVKRAALDWTVEKATELGASRIVPVLTRFTQVERVKTERLRAIALEATEQSRRLAPPEIAEPVALDALLAGWPAGRRLFFGDETGGGRALLALDPPMRTPGGAPPALAWLVGPEGGFAQSELDALRSFPFCIELDLGPRILRAETAALVGLTLLQAWSEQESGRGRNDQDHG